MSIKVERRLAADVETSFRRFSRVQDVPLWVPGVESVEIETTRADGLAGRVRFLLAQTAKPEREYTLEYEYDVSRRVIGWTPREGHDDAVAGYAVFHPLEGLRCRMTYVLEHGARRGDDLETLKAEASRAADGFVVYISKG